MPTIYVHDENHNRYEGMTREQIINAIVQAVEQGEIIDLDDGFITKIKEQNGNNNIQIWIGTSAQFSALQTKNANTLYILSDDDSADDWDQIAEAVEDLADEITKIKNGDDNTVVYKATNAINAQYTSITNGGWDIGKTGTTAFSEAGFYVVRYNVGLTTYQFFIVYDGQTTSIATTITLTNAFLRLTVNPTLKLESLSLGAMSPPITWSEITNADITYKRLY